MHFFNALICFKDVPLYAQRELPYAAPASYVGGMKL